MIVENGHLTLRVWIHYRDSISMIKEYLALYPGKEASADRDNSRIGSR